MLHTRKNAQNELEFVSIEDLVPQDHLLRKIDKYIDFSFILEKVRPYYSEDNGRTFTQLHQAVSFFFCQLDE